MSPRSSITSASGAPFTGTLAVTAAEPGSILISSCDREQATHTPPLPIAMAAGALQPSLPTSIDVRRLVVCGSTTYTVSETALAAQIASGPGARADTGPPTEAVSTRWGVAPSNRNPLPLDASPTQTVPPSRLL